MVVNNQRYQPQNVYVSCAGNWGANNGTVGILDYNIQARPTAPFVFQDAYKAQNGIGIGDAQDLIVFHDKVVVACTTSSKIEVLTDKGKLNRPLSSTTLSTLLGYRW